NLSPCSDNLRRVVYPAEQTGFPNYRTFQELPLHLRVDIPYPLCASGDFNDDRECDKFKLLLARVERLGGHSVLYCLVNNISLSRVEFGEFNYLSAGTWE